MKANAKIYHWYNNLLTEVIRILLFFLLFIFIVLSNGYKIYPNIFITLFGLFIMFELYFSQKIAKFTPKAVSENNGDILDSFSIEALAVFETHGNTSSIIKTLMHFPQINFIVSKCGATNKDVPLINADKKILAKSAFDLAKSLKGNFVTTMDLFAAYLLITEADSKFLFDRKLKEEDLENILLWASTIYSKEEYSKKAQFNFAGEGVAEDWVYGWTLETKKYMVDVSREYVNEGEPVVRTGEYKQMVEALYKGSSVILVGDVGAGKESIVRYFAVESFMGRLKDNLYHQRVHLLMVDALMAGAKTQGELEERLNLTMQELTHSGNVIIYVPQFENILGGSFNLDISGAILPYLKSGKVRIIAAVTPGAYKKYIEPMHSLLDAFTVVTFPQISNEEVLDILFSKVSEIEDKNKVIFSYRAVLAAAQYSKNYSKERVAPGSAVILLEDTANSVYLSGRQLVEERDILDQVKKKVHVEVGEPRIAEKKLLLDLEAQLHKRIISQNEAVSAIAQAIRRLRAGLSQSNKPISFLFLGPTGVGKTETAKALADIYFGQSARLIRLDMSEFSGVDGEKRLLGAPPGQGDEKGQLTEAIYDNPYSLVLLDEFEKADKTILDLFLQVFDDGRLTDNKGKTVSFVNSIIISTSNAASEFIREQVNKGVLIDKNFKKNLLEYLEIKGIFKPELLNRFDDIIVFKPLGPDEVIQIVKLLLTEVSRKLKEKDIFISFGTEVLQKIAKEGFDNDFGARPLKRYIADNIEDLIAQKMLKDEIKRGYKIVVSINQEGKIEIKL